MELTKHMREALIDKLEALQGEKRISEEVTKKFEKEDQESTAEYSSMHDFLIDKQIETIRTALIENEIDW